MNKHCSGALSRCAIIILTCVVAVSAGCQNQDTASAAPKKGGPRGGNFGAVAVEAIPVTRSSLQVVGDYAGEFVPESSARISSDTPGRLLQVHVHVGDEVSPGDVLAEIDALPFQQRVRELQAAVQMAQASIKEAKVQRDNLKADLERRRPLLAREMIAEREIENLEASLKTTEQRISVAEATLAQNRARLTSAQEDLSNTRIKAPFEGRIAERLFDPGTFVSPNQPIFSLVDTRELYLTLRIPEQDSGRVEVGMPARIRVQALGAQIFDGAVHRVAPSLDGATRTLRVDIRLKRREDRSAPPAIKPGMFARAQLELGHAENVLTVPNQAILKERDGKLFVWTISPDGKAVKKTIVTGLEGRENTQVLEGLDDDTQIIVRGQEKLRPDVEVLNIKASSATPEARKGAL